MVISLFFRCATAGEWRFGRKKGGRLGESLHGPAFLGEKTGCGGRNVQKHSKVLPNVLKGGTRAVKRRSGNSKRLLKNM
jgi:hypothetical protein